MTKRMNMPETDTQSVVAPWDDIMATNRPIPHLKTMNVLVVLIMRV